MEYLVVDLEMTGLKSTRDRILEIGAVIIRDGQLAETYATFVNPHIKLEDKIVELTGITNEMAESGQDISKALDEFLAFAGDRILIGHNLYFDYSFLKQAALNLNRNFERRGIDTLKIARNLLKKPEKKSLDSLCSYFHLEREHAHRALDDAIATAKLFLLLKEQYEEEQEEVFAAYPLQYKGKKQTPATPAQKRDLNSLLSYHKIKPSQEIDFLTRSEASRLLDRIYASYGRIPKEEV